MWNTLTKKQVARLGGLARVAKHGSPGTPEGRRLGGLRSLATHHKNKTGFKVLRIIKLPRYSEKLAELLGIVMGDGSLTNYQLTITTSFKNDRPHARHSQKLIKSLFGVDASLKRRANENVVTVVASSKSLVKFFHSLGMSIGSKIKNNISVPRWIYKSKMYKRAFVRGLFDTDGCIYLDRHNIKGKTYYNMGWTITSYIDNLMRGILDILRDLNFSPTISNPRTSAFLRKKSEIVRYFKEIGTNNDKHLKRFKKFIGGVPKWS